VSCTQAQRGEILEIAEIFRAKIVDVGQDTLILETTGTEDKVDAIIDILRPYGFRELVRTGRVAMLRGQKAAEDTPDNVRDYRAFGRRTAAEGLRG
jgi:acetolactate synthase-1/3 small subunit